MIEPTTPTQDQAATGATVGIKDILHKPWNATWQFWFKEQSKDGKHNEEDVNFLSSFSKRGNINSVHVCVLFLHAIVAFLYSYIFLSILYTSPISHRYQFIYILISTIGVLDVLEFIPRPNIQIC